MRNKPRAWLLVLLVAAGCAAVIFAVASYRARALSTEALLDRLPVEDALIAYVDFKALRDAGILRLLDGSKVGEDPEYQAFMRSTGFNYRDDLDAALISLAPTGKYLLVKGRFQWDNLANYAKAQKGSCNNAFCRMPGSVPERLISFYPVRSDLMALAVSQDSSAALAMSEPRGNKKPVDIPQAPIWVSIPAAVLRSGEALPTGTRMFARGMEGAQSVVISFEPESGRVAAKLDVRCRDAAQATEIAGHLTRVTEILRQSLARENQTPNAGDLSGILTAGAFRSEGSRVFGQWPIERAFLDSLAP